MQTTVSSLCRSLALGATLASASVLTFPAVTAAYSGELWMDENVPANERVTTFKKIILFPMTGDSAYSVSYYHGGFDGALAAAMQKKVKNTNFFYFDDGGEAKLEKQQIFRDNPAYAALHQPFANEDARATAVYDATGAEGYLVPHIRLHKFQDDTAPERRLGVPMESYYVETEYDVEVSGKLGYRSWTQDHIIPAHPGRAEQLEIEATLYDAYTHKPAMTYLGDYRGGATTESFATVAQIFAIDWGKLKSAEQKRVPASAPTLGFREVTMPDDFAGDTFRQNAVWYAMKDEAARTLKHVRIDTAPDGGRYYVQGTLADAHIVETHHPSTCTTYRILERTEPFTRKDFKGVEHKMQRKYYTTGIRDEYGYTSFDCHVEATFELVEAATGRTLLRRMYMDTAGSCNDAIRKMLQHFYQDVDDAIGI
ncbi:hypothetical protein [uncultured Selenomonas sp.]|uniref:hypothetical protein n=1 Tax=uncultured Selenomonas sp. TaxID=159275 RepID=UPI0025CE9319|nr:hypothetical protein [uncultured Selenomonas sp.]